jgi:hypothetical protein
MAFVMFAQAMQLILLHLQAAYIHPTRSLPSPSFVDHVALLMSKSHGSHAY